MKDEFQLDKIEDHIYTVIVSHGYMLAYYMDLEDTPSFRKASEQHLSDYAGSKDPKRLAILAIALNIPLFKIKHVKQNSRWIKTTKNKNYEIFQKFIDLLERDYCKTHKVIDFSEKMGISARQLMIICKLHSGDNCKEIIDDRVIAEARRQLQASTDSIKKIGLSLGFTNAYQFSKFFKLHTKVSPEFYRNNSE